MEIKISEKLKKHMTKKGKKIIYVRVAKVECSCFRTTKELEIEYEEPKELEKYNIYNVEDIKVYVGKNIKTINNELVFTIKITPFLLKKIEVEGVLL